MTGATVTFGACPSGHPGDRCQGTLLLAEKEGPIWVFRCDRCGYETGVPTTAINPDTTRKRRLEQTDIPHRFYGLRFEQDAYNRPALELVHSWLAGADENPVDRATSLLPAPALWGAPGRGKTHLLAAISARLVRELDLSVWFRSARQLLRGLQEFEDGTAERVWARATTVDVLALDDLGAQRGTEWRHDQLADLIDERYQRELPVLVATNYAPTAWEGVLDERTRSRLRGMTFSVELKGRDRRQNTDRREG